jgi:hypothetical protein
LAARRSVVLELHRLAQRKPPREESGADAARQRTLLLAAVGIAIGAVSAPALTRGLATLLAGISASDPAAFFAWPHPRPGGGARGLDSRAPGHARQPDSSATYE